MKPILLLLASIAVANGMPASVLSDIPASVYSSDIVKMEAPLQTERSLSEYIEYDDLVLAEYPSAECAEDTLEQEIRSHASTVQVIEDAISSPSTITQPTYVEHLETEYPSIVSAYKTIFTLESSHPALAYIQSLLTSEEIVHPTILTDVNVIAAMSSPTTVADEKIVYDAIRSSPSIKSYLHVVSELTGHYPSLAAAETVIQYYERVEPSIVPTVEEAVFSPSVEHSPLPEEYPTLAKAILTLASYKTVVVPKDQVLIESYDVNSATIPKEEVAYVKELISEYPKVASAEAIVASYDKVSPSLVVNVGKEVQSPQVLHEKEIVDYPTLAHAYNVVHQYDSVLPSAVVEIVSKLEISPKEVKESSMAEAESDAAEHEQLAAAYKIIASYKKSIPSVLAKVSHEVSSIKVAKAQKVVQQHQSLYHAFKVVSKVAKKYQMLKQAQISINCAESAHQSLFSAYQRISYAKQSAHQYIHHGAVVQKSVVNIHHHGGGGVPARSEFPQ